MGFLESFWNEIVGFFGVNQFLTILQNNEIEKFLTYEGIVALIIPIIPLLLFLELSLGFIYKKPQTKVYKVIFLIYLFNRVIGRFIAIGMVTLCIGLFQPFALVETSSTRYWFIYGYIIWEFAHFIYHFLAHKVRLLWCLHATHHSPEEMNLSVTHAHFFLEAPYADFIRTSICMILGVNPVMLFAIMFIDGTYGAFIHVGENLIKDARFGFLNKFILTPSHHRVHHGTQENYLDRNHGGLLIIWYRMFGTFEPEGAKVVYGLTKNIETYNPVKIAFHEWADMLRDAKNADSLADAWGYIFNEPGWQPKKYPNQSLESSGL